MVTYAKSTFNAVRYASIRPTYPPQLFELVFNYHSAHPAARWETAVDLGCGTGIVTSMLKPRFHNVIGVDPSKTMLEQAKKALGDGVKFVQASAESLLEEAPELEGEVDVITAGQAAHWFKYPQVYSALRSLLRPQTGTFIFWGYSEFRLTNYPALTKYIHEYSQGSDEKNNIGPHWEQPGRSILDSHFENVKMPSKENGFEDVKRVLYGEPHFKGGSEGVENYATLLKRRLEWRGLEEYLNSFSALHTFHERFEEDKGKRVSGKDGVYGVGEGDIVQRFLGRVQNAIREGGGQPGEFVDIEWPLAVFMARRQ